MKAKRFGGRGCGDKLLIKIIMGKKILKMISRYTASNISAM